MKDTTSARPAEPAAAHRARLRPPRAGDRRVAQGAAVSRGVVTDHVTVRLPVGGQLLVPVAVAWAQCACGEHLGWVGDARDNAVAGLR